MGIHNIIEQQVQQQVWLNHHTFHLGFKRFDEMCVLCVEELQEAQIDHVQGEANDQLREEMEEDEETLAEAKRLFGRDSNA
jgi:hypothetical protein